MECPSIRYLVDGNAIVEGALGRVVPQSCSLTPPAGPSARLAAGEPVGVDGRSVAVVEHDPAGIAARATGLDSEPT